MDDFLHNLRSGNLRLPDRGQKKYQNSQRKGSNYHKKKDTDSKLINESLSAIKIILESISENQKKATEAYAVRLAAEERKADAMEVIAEYLKNFLPVGQKISPPIAQKDTEQKDTEQNQQKSNSNLKLDHENRENILKIIKKMREDQISWEKIAAYLTKEKIPTLSGKGRWRGSTLQRLYTKKQEK